MGMLITLVTLRRARKAQNKRRRSSRMDLESARDVSEGPLREDSFVLFRFHTEPWRGKDGREDSGR
jgi:hypothetical protein